MHTQRSSFISGDGIRIVYQFDGEAGLPILLLSNSIGTDLHMWDEQIPLLAEHFQILRYDARGHGASDAPAGPYSLDRLGRDAVELLDTLQLRCAHVLGLSLGGYVGQWLGIHTPARVDRLVLSNTAAYLGPAATWDTAIEQLLQAPDMVDTAAMFMRNWFPQALLASGNSVVERFRTTLLSARREGIAGSWAAVRDADLRRTVRLIENPTLVIAGEHDTVTSVHHGREIAAAIPGARFEVFPTVHLSNVERPSEFVELVKSFLLTP